jgi:hypothetical protein
MGDKEMSRICHAHCPPGGSVLGGALAVVAVAAIAAAVAQVVASVAAVVMVAGFAVLAASVAAGVAFVHRANRPVPLDWSPQGARAARALVATPVQAALPVRQRAALTSRRVVPGVVVSEMEEVRRDR